MSRTMEPSSLNATFDASLIDVQKSFSSTETNTSGSDGKENIAPEAQEQEQPRRTSPFTTVSTDLLYTQWASTYDSDGNVLQAADDIQMHSLLPSFMQMVSRDAPSVATLRILDLGCGTGRNTVKLLDPSYQGKLDIIGWDSNAAMLDIAKAKFETTQSANLSLRFELLDLWSVANVPARYTNSFHGVISTLVLEHLPVSTYFSIINRVLQPGGYALVTNMHSEMGARSQAGYKTSSGERFKATSYVYTVESTIVEAEKAGLELVGEVREMAADERMIDGGVVESVKVEKGMVAERARKWVGTRIWYGMVLKKR